MTEARIWHKTTRSPTWGNTFQLRLSVQWLCIFRSHFKVFQVRESESHCIGRSAWTQGLYLARGIQSCQESLPRCYHFSIWTCHNTWGRWRCYTEVGLLLLPLLTFSRMWIFLGMANISVYQVKRLKCFDTKQMVGEVKCYSPRTASTKRSTGATAWLGTGSLLMVRCVSPSAPRTGLRILQHLPCNGLDARGLL